ncbi:MAG: methionyl-tRNA formyltransferase [Candidatus Marinimicrobia bacterium]|jgi:methionyl-tRNA formyltransferase|nr:methionyl-tRNA formyltransferase [Candidatus Neomarinimicrobiota bacterium]MBT3732134.1 methionyl-tRNA formyltransferase [Candidatus Neomarinimicrobiota bacterium]MBT4990794.1 methionyl-tRNA formyltransferase [Candidatus Neomarinimicrobiota bacterium]MBT5355746.1 methionyl-tRNA formyltransferase [Candidatus Neomarinimicrobiota bacterium]MBT6913876.1 methionyl-tRNA formyltransferase [Candidatus Neomarinimicrobiota bacterium]
MGNPNFAIPCLKQIMESEHELVAVVSNPEKRMGRGKQLSHTPVGKFAVENELPLVQAESLTDPTFIERLKSYNADLNILVAYRILPQVLIDLPTKGSINLHASLLPKYRGAAPIQWALMNGDKATGLSTFFLEKSVDTGKMIHQISIPILEDDDYASLSERLSQEGAKLLVKTVDAIATGEFQEMNQNEKQISRAPKISKEMTQINWGDSGEKIANWIRGLSPKPGMQARLNEKGIRLFKGKYEESISEKIQVGEIYDVEATSLKIGTGKGYLHVSEVQLEGKRRMTVKDFLLGNDIHPGDTFEVNP